jgi:hypothetical protein
MIQKFRRQRVLQLHGLNYHNGNYFSSTEYSYGSQSAIRKLAILQVHAIPERLKYLKNDLLQNKSFKVSRTVFKSFRIHLDKYIFNTSLFCGCEELFPVDDTLSDRHILFISR